MQRKRWTEQLSLGNGEVIALKLIKHGKALLPGSFRKFEAPERLSGTLTEHRGWNVDHGQAAHELKGGMVAK